MKNVISKRLIWVSTEDTILESVRLMKEFSVSSVLVVNSQKEVVGIITERDIVQKFTLLEVQDKLLAKAGVFMTRPVYFAKVDTLESDVNQLVGQFKIRHFPVTKSSNQLEDIVGMITVTDLALAWLRHSGANHSIKQVLKSKVFIISDEGKDRQLYQKLFFALNWEAVVFSSGDRHLDTLFETHEPVLIDLDGMDIERIRNLLTSMKTSENSSVYLLSSDNRLVQPLQIALKNKNYSVLLKPMDLSHLIDLISSHQRPH